jgi:DNA-binding MarR family transcriptional regulator
MGTPEKLQPKGFATAAAAAWVGIFAAGDYLSHQAEDVFRTHGVTGDQYNVLRILRGARPHGLARREITARLLRRAPDVTRMLDRLEASGLIERGRDAEDARRSIARITRRGLALLDRVDPEIEQAMAVATAPLRESELREVARLCGRLVP